MSFEKHLNEAWMGAWLDAVARGSPSTSHRPLSSIERHGGVAAAVAAAQARKVHLAEVSDGTGARMIAASSRPITTLC